MKKSLIYNSASIFALIDNVQNITYNFSGKSYTIERNVLENNYPNYLELKQNNNINIENFNKYVENKMGYLDFIERTFSKLF